jgi:hypothetical protein
MPSAMSLREDHSAEELRALARGAIVDPVAMRRKVAPRGSTSKPRGRRASEMFG